MSVLWCRDKNKYHIWNWFVYTCIINGAAFNKMVKNVSIASNLQCTVITIIYRFWWWPFRFNLCKDVWHHCPQCEKLVGAYDRLCMTWPNYNFPISTLWNIHAFIVFLLKNCCCIKYWLSLYCIVSIYLCIRNCLTVNLQIYVSCE